MHEYDLQATLNCFYRWRKQVSEERILFQKNFSKNHITYVATKAHPFFADRMLLTLIGVRQTNKIIYAMDRSYISYTSK